MDFNFIGNGLISTFVSAIFYVVYFLARLIVKIACWPVYLVLQTAFPDATDYLNNVSTFLSNYLFKGIAFAREVFFNITGFPRPLFYILIAIIGFRLGFMVTKIAIRFIINGWGWIRAGRASLQTYKEL